MEQSESTGSIPFLAGVNQFREMLYLFFSRGFSKEADPGYLEDVKKVVSVLEDLSGLVEFSQDPDIQEGKRELEDFLDRGGKGETGEIIEGLRKDYASAFLGTGAKTVALCESSYHGQTGSLFQTPYFEVRERYEDVGMEKSSEFKEPDDHLSVELAHMANLCRLMIAPDGNGGRDALYYLGAQREFMRDHLTAWIPVFVQDLREKSNAAFYNALGRLVNGYIKLDAVLIDSLTEEVKK